MSNIRPLSYVKGYTCIVCGNPRSDRSELYCMPCNKHVRTHVNKTLYPDYAKTSSWFEDSLGVKTRLHGDLEEVE